jgi:AcrR family transcriptional regulator
MSMPDKPTTTRAEARQSLEDAAARLFARKGYANTTVDDIVEDAGVSKPALYRHFESKKHLHMTLLEHHRDGLAATALKAGFESDGDIDARLHHMIDAWFSYVEEHPYSWLLFRDTTGDPDVQALYLDLHKRQRDTDVALLREFTPGIPERELEPLGETIRSCLHGLARLWLDRPDIERDALVAAMMRVLRGIRLTTGVGDLG